MKHPTRLPHRGFALVSVVLSSLVVPSLAPAKADAEDVVLGFSGTARGNVLFLAVNIPLPVLEAGMPGTVVEISSEPLASALAMPADPGFVPRFLLDTPAKKTGLKLGAACTNPVSLVQTQDSYSPVPGRDAGSDGSDSGSMPGASASCPAIDHAVGTATFGSLGNAKSGLRIGLASSRAESRRLEGSAFESTATAFLSEVVIGPVVLRGLSYFARALANGAPGGAVVERSSAVQEISVNGQKVSGPLDLGGGAAAGVLTQINTALVPTGFTLAMTDPSSNLVDDNGAAADAEASSLVLREANASFSGGGYSLTSAIYLGRARACLNLSVLDGPPPKVAVNCSHL